MSAAIPVTVGQSNIVVVGPLVDYIDGITPETGVSLGSADAAKLVHESASTVDVSGNTWSHVANGMYRLTLTSGNLPTQGRARLVLLDADVFLPYAADLWVTANPHGSNVTISPIVAQTPSNAVADSEVIVYEDSDRPTVQWTVVDASGTAIDLSTATIKIKVYDNDDNAVVYTVTSGIVVSGASNNIVTWTPTTTESAAVGNYRYELRQTSSVNRVLARGPYIVKAGPAGSW